MYYQQHQQAAFLSSQQHAVPTDAVCMVCVCVCVPVSPSISKQFFVFLNLNITVVALILRNKTYTF